MAIVGFCNVELKPFGPVHAYVAPATALEVRFNELPTQTGLFELAVGVLGILFTTTLVVEGELAQPFTVAITLYVPVAKTVGLAMLGFCNVDVNPFGPVQEYVAPAMAVEVRFNGLPTQTGAFELAAGLVGILFIVTLVVPAKLAQPPEVALTL